MRASLGRCARTFRGGGGLARGRRLLDGLQPGPEHGWLAFLESYLAAAGDGDRAMELAVVAVALGRLFDGTLPRGVELERTEVVATPHATHLTFRVAGRG